MAEFSLDLDEPSKASASQEEDDFLLSLDDDLAMPEEKAEAPELSMQALDEMVELLSEKSLDILNGFKDDITGMPPDLHELFKESRFVVM